MADHEANYTPSNWSKRFGPVEILEHYYRFATKVTQDARKTVPCQLDVPYGKTANTKFDIYGTHLPKDAPIFAYIHGGYWQEGSRDVAGFAVPVFVAKGIKVITIGYDLCPDVKLGEIVSEIKAAIEELLKLARNDGCRCVWVAGHSAGAHLAASLLFDESWIEKMTELEVMEHLKGLVLIGGIYDLNPLLGTTINDKLQLTKEEIEAYSFTKIDTKCKPDIKTQVIVTDGECDSPEFVNESRTCAQKLITMVDDVRYLLLRDNVDHFDIVEKLTEPDFPLTSAILAGMLVP